MKEKKKPDQKKQEKDIEKVPFNDFIEALLEVPPKPKPRKRKPLKNDSTLL